MKKIIIFLFLIVVILFGSKKNENILIPENAIRFRVIANSNEKDDQNLKMTIKKDVENEIYKLIGNVSSIYEARTIINNNLDLIDNILKKYNVEYMINYGDNYFPEKEYRGIKYREGNYESLVITLGSGMGKNWWCVLFPPLCLLDEKDNLTDLKYELYAKKLINNFK